jgi:hypothetical protein
MITTVETWTWATVPFAYIHWLVIILALVWSMVWKGIALWRAGSNRQLAWFIVIFIVNTLGILEIIYIFAFSRKKKKEAAPTES